MWITGWRPKGFEKFFTRLRRSERRARLRRPKSVSPDIIGRVIKDSERYGMFVKVPPV